MGIISSTLFLDYYLVWRVRDGCSFGMHWNYIISLSFPDLDLLGFIAKQINHCNSFFRLEVGTSILGWSGWHLLLRFFKFQWSILITWSCFTQIPLLMGKSFKKQMMVIQTNLYGRWRYPMMHWFFEICQYPRQICIRYWYLWGTCWIIVGYRVQ